MEKEINVLKMYKVQIEKGRSNFKKSPKERITESYVTARLEALESLMAKFIEKNEMFIATYNTEEIASTDYIEKDVFDEAYETFLLYKSELHAVLNTMKQPKVTEFSNEKDKESLVRLPKISIPVFSGKYTEWSSFKDLFCSLIHDNVSLDDVQRLHYLKTLLKGEAEQLVKQIPITQSNYKKCWDLLKNRYDNKRFMSNCILKRLFGQRVMNCESAQALKELLDTTCDCIHELSNLGIKVETWDVIVIYVVSQKLDAETRKQWELHVNGLEHDLPSFSAFKDFLESRFRALEFIEPGRNKPKSHQTVTARVLHSTSNLVCPHCNEDHKIYSCPKFAKEDVSRRQDIAKTLGLCFNCLGVNHTGKICRIPSKCRICKGKHHTLLHGRVNPITVAVATDVSGNDDVQPESSIEPKEAMNIVNHFATGKVNQTLLATALVKAESKNGSRQILRALLDQGSQASFISEASVQLLQLNKISVKSCITGLGGGQSGLTSKHVVMVNIQSLHDPSFKIQVKAHVLNTVTSILPEKKIVLPNWIELGDLKLADPQYNMPNKIDILLGCEVYGSILKSGLIKGPTGGLIAQDTCFGWILSGQVSGYNANQLSCHNVIMSLQFNDDANEILKKFWEIESEPSLSPKILTPEEQACEEHFATTTRRNDAGQYVVELPFRQNISRDYGDTRKVAFKRMLSLERRLEKSPEQKKNYGDVLEEYLTLGHMEELSSDTSSRTGVWLPHHAVVRLDKSTTKTRVVFNASDRSANGLSLNDTLMVGPTLQPELRHTIMRWRLYPICLTADIIKMYRQVRVADKHCDYQRILWRSDPNANLKDYRLLTVTFGTSSAPYLAVKALQQVAVDECQDYPYAASKVKTDFYMDDLLTGCHTEEEAISLFYEMNGLLEKGGFKLQKWSSNKTDLLAKLKETTGMDKIFTEDDVTKVVGLGWNRLSDEFNYKVKSSDDSSVPHTKREVIAEISRLYDPLGWIAPCIIIAKIFIQRLWLTGLGWDDRLPDDLLREWDSYRKELTKLTDFHIPRWIHTKDNDVNIELHGFSDASNTAYAAVVYIRCVANDGSVTCYLVTAKSKVAPIKQLSVPRLELSGAVLVTKLLVEVGQVLEISKDKMHAWTDSSIVLAWLSDHPSRWKTFVANRTSEILNLLDSSHWSYVQSKDNPADCASRGLLPSDFIDHKLWKHGPDWLRSDDIPYGKPKSILTKQEMELRTIKVHLTSLEEQEVIITKFSSFRKLIRVVAYCRRFLKLKDPIARHISNTSYLTVSEIQDALTCCIRRHQACAFSEELDSLLREKVVSKKSKIYILNPFIDDRGILRVGGRIENSELPNYSKHPIIISGESHLAKLLVADAHEKTLHGGQQLTGYFLRSKYWITKMKNIVRAHIHECVPCIRNAARTRTQLMGQLPSCRVTPKKVFLHSGVDYAGPINIRFSKGRGQRSYKGYICLFICMVTRAVHLEAVSDLTSEGFLSAFKRFVARRGHCSDLWSDNGTNFVGASRELKKMLSSESSSFSNEVASALANNSTQWHFIPPHAPNFGGLWEAGIKSTKHHLRRVIGDATLTYEELATMLVQIEACLNSRPLSELSSDPDDPVPLTPGHFLVGEPLLLVPDKNFEFSRENSLRRWQVTQRMVQNFWRRWSKEYLTHFFKRYKWKTPTPDLHVDDVVLVKEDNLPPAKWLYGRVVKVYPGQDNHTRVVTLRCKNSTVQRPASKLCPIVLNSDDS